MKHFISLSIPFWKKNWLFIFIGLMCVFLCSRPLYNQLIWDDAFLISANPTIGDGSKFMETVGQPFWQNSAFSHAPLTGFWRPVTSFVFWSVGLLTKSPWLFHLLAVLAALTTAILSGMAVRKWLPSEISWHSIAIGCSIYFFHPLTAETYCLVANISDHLALSFFFLCLLSAIQYASNPTRFIWLIAVFVTSLLSCGSKEFGVLSAVIPLSVTAFRPVNAGKTNNTAQALHRKHSIALWLTSTASVVLYLILRHVVIETATFTQTMHWSNVEIEPFTIGFGLALKQIFYLGAFPLDVMVKTPWLYRMLSILVAAFLAASVVYGARQKSAARKKHLPFYSGGVLIFSTMLLTPSFLTVIPDSRGFLEFPSRYFHFAVWGAAFIAVPYLHNLLSSTIGKAVLLVVFALMATQSCVRISHWRDAVALFSEEVRINPTSERAVTTLGESLLDVYAFTEAEKLITAYEIQYGFKTPFFKAYRDSILSEVALLRDGNFKESLFHAKKAIENHAQTPLFVIRLATILEVSGNPNIAVKILTQALSSSDFSPQQKTLLRNELKRIQKTKK